MDYEEFGPLEESQTYQQSSTTIRQSTARLRWLDRIQRVHLMHRQTCQEYFWFLTAGLMPGRHCSSCYNFIAELTFMCSFSRNLKKIPRQLLAQLMKSHLLLLLDLDDCADAEVLDDLAFIKQQALDRQQDSSADGTITTEEVNVKILSNQHHSLNLKIISHHE